MVAYQTNKHKVSFPIKQGTKKQKSFHEQKQNNKIQINFLHYQRRQRREAFETEIIMSADTAWNIYIITAKKSFIRYSFHYRPLIIYF